ncbi:ABC transporter ATP-binding protein [Sphingomonas limnosediminicola]|uniref:ABC transporter ATP-binding protein n=1 Tax=Sphingomonas limnosediminicola TaxID=940133 RepID=A0ABP7KWW6_9SPHN
MTPRVEARGVTIDQRLRSADLDLGPGELVALIGRNGGGKTSLLRALAGIEADGGSVRIDGASLEKQSPARRPYLVTFAPASRDLTWPIRVRDVIALGLPRPDRDRVEAMIRLLELEQLADRPADRLSTGERARVLTARALAPSPKLLLLDEPLSNLDPYWVLRLLEILRDAVEAGATALVAVHDIDRIREFDRAILIDDGAIRADLPPSQMLESTEVAEAFRIQRDGAGWRVRPTAGPRSSR